jgi:hypothetical protein
MNHKIALLILLLLSFHYSKAQKAFEPGYLLIAPNDTLRGYIDYKNWSRNPETISFKISPEEKAETYGLGELTGFYVHGESYIKAEVDVDITPSKVDELAYSPLPKLQRTTAFLLTINGGPKGLFYLNGKGGKVQLYISDKPGIYQLLINHRYITSNGLRQIVTPNQFRTQLKNFFSECEGLIADNTAISYSSQSIEKVFNRYYEKCTSKELVTAYKLENSQVQVGVVAGLSASKLSFKGAYSSKILKGNFPISNNVSGGLFLNITVPRLKQRFSVYNELAFVSYKTSTVYQIDYSDNNYNRWTNSLGYGYIKLTNMARYHIPAGNVKLFVNGGISNAIAVSETNKEITESSFYTSQPVVTENVVFGDTRKYELGFAVGLGAVYKKFGAELRHESTNGMSVLVDLKSTIKRYYFLLSYRLK